MQRSFDRARPIAEAMEERILHSADLSPLQHAPVVTSSSYEAPASNNTPSSTTAAATQPSVTTAANAPAREIVFIDAELSGIDSLLLDLQTQRQAGRSVDIVLVGADVDGIALISSTLAGRSDITAVHLLAHGGDGELQLGRTRLDAASLLQRAGEIAGWGDALGADADLLLYGCDVAGSDLGRAFALELAQLTGADVAASTDLTGAAALGGDWVLEYESGEIEAAGIAGSFAQQAWEGVLATYVADPTIADGATGSLRWAINQANANAGTDTVQLLAGTHRITLAGSENANLTGDFDIVGDLVLSGASTNPADTVVQSSVVDRVFDVSSGVVSFSNLTITGGNGVSQGGALNITNAGQVSLTNMVLQGNSANNGGGVYNVGSVTMDRVRITGNSGSTSGGGLNNRGVATLTDVEISGNTNSGSGGGISQQGGIASLSLNRVTISGNTAGSNGGGIWGGGGTLSATNVSISGNTATQGGGLYANLDGYSISHSTIANNTATGGANAGGGIWTNPGPPPKQVTLTSTILASNTGGNANVGQISGGHNIDTDGTAIAAGGTDLNPTVAALKLGALLDMGGFTKTHLLMGGSVAINTGSLSAPATDQRGVARVGRADVGAFEFDGKLIVTTTADVVDGATTSISALLGNMGADGRISLREAIIATNNTAGSDEVIVPTGTYLLSLAGSNEKAALTGDLNIIGNLSLRGAGSAQTIIDAAGIDRVFDLRSGASASFSGMTIRGGAIANNWGAGINAEFAGVSVTLDEVRITGNSADSGAGIYSFNATLLVNDSTIDGNTGKFGAGIYNDGGAATINRTTISGNNASQDGAGIYNSSNGATLQLSNVTLAGNVAAGAGGALYSRQNATIVNTTIAGNTAASGGGILVANPGTVSLRNTILANNTGGNSSGAITSLGHNIDSGNTAGLTGTGDRINTNPLLGALQFNGGTIKTMAIGAGSAAIDGGTATGAPTVDARGFLRITNDIGAYERNSLLVDTTSDVVDGTTSSIDALLANRGADGRISLREAVIATNNTAGVDDISLPTGTYALSIGGADEDLAASGDLDVRDGVRISGGGAASTVVSGGGTLAVMQFVSGSSTLSGVSVASGYSSSGAGGLQVNAGATLAISQSVVRNNRNDDNGAGIVNAGNLTLTDVEVRDNTSSKDGGGLLNTGGTLTLNRVTIAGNSAVKGGGLQMLDGVASLTNVTVSHNTGSNKSGGLGIFGGTASLLNVTIADNQSASVGGLDHSSLPAGAITLRNVLFAGNQNGNIRGDDIDSSTVTSLGNNLSTTFSPELSAASDRRSAVAKLGTLGDWGGFTRTRPLLSGSAAINNGNTAAAPTTDQREIARVGNADIGAFEFGGAANSAPVLDASKAPALESVSGGAAAPVGAVGTRVFKLVDAASPAGQLDNVSDADAGALLGIAVIGADSTNGTAWWSIDDGANWATFGSVTPGTARLLTSDGVTRVYYQPAAGFTGTLGSVLTIRAWDGSSGVNGGTGDSTVNGGSTAFSVVSDTVSLLVAAPPVVVTSSGSLAYTENAAPAAVDPTLTVSDADSATLVGATVSITANHASSEDVLAFANQAGITGSWDATTGVLSLTGNASVASYQAALRSVTYANTSESPSTLQRMITFIVDDGSIASAAASRTVAVTSVDDAPIVTTSAGTLAYTENDAAIEVDPALVVADVDHAQLASASVTIAANYRSDQDSLLFTDQFGITGSWNAATGVLDLTGSASVAAYEAALRSVRYVNTSEVPSGAPRTIAFVVSDGVIASTAASRTVSIAAVNDAPQVTTTAGTLSYVENAGAVAIDANLSIADADHATLVGATVRITANHAAAQDRLVFSDQSGISGLFDAATGVLTLSGSASLTAYQAALRSVAYVNDSDAPSTLARTISFSVDDGTTASAAATRIVSVAAVNDAPVVYVPAGQTTLANNAVIFSAANGNAITIGDADAAAASVQLMLSVTNGTLTLGTLAGLSFSTGDGTADATVRFTGTLGAINAALDGLRFDPTANLAGTAVLTIDTSDLGNSGSGGALVDSETIPIEVLSGNTAPVLSGANAFASIAEDATGNNGTLVSTLIATRVTDADAGALSGIAVTAVDDTQGQWQFSSNGGTSWTAFGTPTASSARLLAADANTRVRFVPSANWNGSVSNGISFRAWDQRSGTAGGTADTTQANPVVRDEFTSVSYANNDSATASWSGSWMDSDGSASSGQISIGSGRMNFAGSLLSSSSVQRQVNLAGATAATLSFDFSSALGLSTLTLEASRNGGATWTTLQNTWPNGGGTATGNLSSFLSATTRIRFTISGVLGGGNFSVDNLQIAWTKPLNGGSTAFSSAIFSSGITVTPVNDAATGVPTISGSATENQTLSAGTSGLADIDGIGAFAYQWLRGGVAISGATGSTLLLGDADVGSAISVRVNFTDAQGSAESVTSAATALVAGVNDAPTGLPTITGSAAEDGTLSANVAGIADVDGLGAFSYQWLRDGSAISGATGSTLLLGDADVGKRISVRVNWTDGQGTAESLMSAETTAVANVNDAPTGLPTISGSAVEDQTLSAVTSGLADADGLGAFSYQWLRGGAAISGATASTLLLGDADVGQAISVRVRWTDGNGTAELVTSAATAAVANVNDAPTGLPTIGGSAAEYQTLTALTSGLADVDGLGAFSHQWLRNGVAISGATGSSLVLGAADIGTRISVRVNWTDARGTVESATSAQTALVTNVNDPPTGSPSITGSVTEDATLGVDTSAIADIDGLGSFSYQWLRDGSAISGATASTLLLGDADVGKRISVRVNWTDGQGTAESLTSVQTSSVANVNDAPSGTPTISGSATENQTLTAVTTSLADADGLGPFSYQWLRNGSAISGATASTLLLGDADVGQAIRVRVNWTDGNGTAESVTSAATAAVTNVNDAPTGVPTIGGSAAEYQTLTALTSGIADVDGLGAFSHQWLRNGVAISGATGSSLVLGAADIGSRISVRVNWTDAYGTAESVTSVQTAPVTNVNDAPTGLPSITGSVTEDATLGIDTSAIADADGLGAFSVQWLRDGSAISGATASTFVLGDADVGRRISVRVNYVDGQGTAESLTSAQTATVANINDAPTGVPTIAGSATENQTLSAVTGGIADADGLGAFSYQWLRNGTAISGATGSTLLLGDADVGRAISVRVNFTDAQGSAESVTSAASALVANVNDAPTGLPSITGSVTEDATLSVDTSAIADIDGLGAFSYQWLRDGSAIAGATASTLVLSDADVGKRISIRLNWTDGQGTAESLTSVQTALVANVNDAPTGLPTISGSAVENQTLTAVTSGLADADGLGAFSYQWLRNGTAISGATASTLLLGDADVGQSISVRVRWTDGNGTAESVTSAATASVVNVNDAPTGVPTIGGSAIEYQTLTAATSGVADADGLGAFSHQWLRNGVAISGATGSSLVLGAADIGTRISVRVNWVDGQGTAESVTSAQTAPVTNVNDAPTGLPSITGSVTEDATLGVNTSAIADIDGLGAFSYQWLRDGSAITGATSSTLLLGDADVGKRISVRVNWTDGQGTAESLTSAQTTTVANVNDAPTGTPTISGSAVENQTLSAVTSGLADADGIGAFSYQWLRNGSAISGATASTLLLGDADVGQSMSVRVNWTDGNGTAEALTSAATAPVTNVNDAPRGSNASLAVTRNGSRTLVAADFGFADYTGESNALQSVRVLLPSAGTLRLAGTLLSATTEVTRAQLDAGALVYAPVTGGSGNAYATIGFQVRDDGGTANGGADLDPVVRLLTIDIVNRAPTITSDGGGATAAQTVAENTTAVTTVSATDADGDALTYSIVGGADAARLRIDASTGALRFVVPPNAEAPIDADADNVYRVTVRASDGVSNDEQALSVRVTDVVEAIQNTFESRVNTTTGDSQLTAMANRGSTRAVALAPDGSHVVVWSSLNQDGSGWGVYGQRFDKAGTALGGEFRINLTTSGDQFRASVATDAAGNFVVAWTTAPGSDGMRARVYAADGTARSGEIQVNTVTTGNQTNGSVAMDANGNFIVVWQGPGPTDGDGIFARRFDASGTPMDGIEFRVNADLLRPHYDAAVSMNASGAFAIAWDNGVGVQLRRYAADGSALGGQVVVSSASTAANPALALADDGVLQVVWRETAVDQGVYLQRYSAGGALLGSRVVVNTVTGGNQTEPSIAVDGNGRFVVAWEGIGAADDNGVFLQKFDASGVRIGANVLVNQTTAGAQNRISVAMLDPDNLVAVWSGRGVGDSTGVFMRQFGSLNTAPRISGVNPLASVAEDSMNAAGTLVSALLSGRVSDPDPGALTGIAVVGVDDSRGAWQYSVDGGTRWAALGLRSDASARLLAADALTRVRFVPAAQWHGSVAGLTLRAWDRSSGSADTLVDASVNGGMSAFSSQVVVASITVTPVNDAPTGTPTITGAAVEDSILTLDTSGIADRDGLGAFAIQWLRDGAAVAGANGTTFQLGDADVGRSISVRVGWTDGDGTAEALTSAATAPIANVNDAPTGLPTITGSAVEDATLTSIVSGIADADGLGSFSRQWLRDGVAITGATGVTYTLGDADVGARIGVRVSWIDGNGSAEVLTSATTVPVININDVPSGAPTVAGSAVEDSPLSAVVTTIGDADGLGTFAWQWLRDGAAIAGATGSTFVPGDADVGGRISVRVDWTDGRGTAETLTSAATAPVANVNDVPTGTPAITGSAIEDGLLAIDTTAIGDADGLGSFALQWLRDGTAIAGATGTSLLLGDGDVGRSISVRVSWIDGHGTAESLTSAATAAVVNVNDAPVLESPLRDRRAVVGEPFVLAVPDATFSDIDAGDSLVLSATKADGGSLPAWLRFDAATRSFSGTPERGDTGGTLIRLQATDSAGASVFDEIRIEVVLGNAAPIAGRAVGDQQALEDAPFTLVLAPDTFVDTDHRDVLELRASLATGEALPSWLSFDAATATFSGMATNADVGSLRIRITATDLVGASGATEFTLRVINSNDAPVAAALPDQRVREDEPLRIVVPADTFSDVDAGDALAFSARLANGAALPAWLRFDSATLTFSGTPGEGDSGAIAVRVTATDNAGASAASDFTLTVDPVNDAPVLAASLPSLQVDQGGALSWTLPADRFTDVDAGDALTYGATLANGAALPGWLRFDAATRTLSGTPGAGDIGLLTLRIVATDGAGTSAAGELLLTVRDVNDAPVLRGSAALPAGLEDAAGPAMRVRDLIAGQVTDDDAGALAGIAVIAADQTHGRWQYSTDGATWIELGALTAQSARLLAADETTALRFIPTADWHGDVAAGLVLRAWDRSSGTAGAVADASTGGGASAFSTATATVALQVLAVNDEPVLVKGPADQSLTAGQRIELVLADGTFADRDTGDVLRYQADLSDGKPLPDWLQFDTGALTFKGSPSAADIGVMTVRVTATDAAGASAQALFVIDIQQAPEEPRGMLLAPEPLPTPETAVPAPAAVSEPARGEQTIADEPVTHFTPARQLADVDTSLPEFAALSAPATGGGVDRTPPPANRADAVLATLPAAVFSELKVDQTLQLLRSEELLRRFDDLKHQMKDLGEEQRRVMASSLAITSGLSIGYVVWLVRGGVLVSSMLSALPAWQLIDPMPVLAAAGAVKKRLRGAAGMAKDGDERDVEELFDGQEPEARPAPPTRETAPERLEGRAR